MKPLKIFALSCVSAVVMTFTATVALGGVSNEPVLSPGNDTAEIYKVLMKEIGGCTLVFSLDGHAVNIEEPITEKCKEYSVGQKVKF